ncbi:MAG: hypothetical protein O2780_14815 [Proteobacteria bacterium]|nr:hypothetical protein [Pseudomonadota bacterium]
MSKARNKVSGTSIITAESVAALERLCPDLAQWPHSWRVEDKDIAAGQEIVEHLKPFLHELLRQGLAAKTLARHRDHVYMLGGEVIRRRHVDPELCQQSIPALIFNLIEDEGGPLIWPRISESQQRTFDATCRKLYRFLEPGNVS